MEDDDSPNNMTRSEEELSVMTLEVKKKPLNKKQKNRKKNKKLKEKIFSKNLKYYNDNDTFYKFVGKSLFLFMNSNDDPLLIIGPDWPLVVCLFSLVLFFYIIIIIKFWARFDLSGKLVNQISFWIFMISFLHSSLINQGYPKNTPGRRKGLPREKYYFCDECQFYVEKKVDFCHCDKCGLCVEGHDHHCAWIGKCVGKNNSISFYIFAVAVIFSSIYILMFFQKIFT